MFNQQDLQNYITGNFAMSEVSPKLKNLEKFLAVGFPSKKMEDFKYTSFQFLKDAKYNMATMGLSHEKLKQIKAELSNDHTNLVIINGAIDATLSDDLTQVPGLNFQELTSFNDLTHDKNKEANSLAYLNLALSKKVQKLTVTDHAAVQKPVHVLFVRSGLDTVTHSQFYFEVMAHASVQLIETYYSFDDEAGFSNSYAQVKIHEGAKVLHIREQHFGIQERAYDKLNCDLESSVEYDQLNFQYGSVLTRADLQVDLNGKEAMVQILGAVVASGTQHLDNSTNIRHNLGENQTTQLYKSILSDEAQSVFRGLVHIAPHALRANSDQLNKNLLLSKKAQANSLPQLEVYADDVKATHGSTVGQMSSEELFYFMSRAISKTQAVELMSLGYLQELVFKLKNPILNEWLIQKMSKTFTKLKVTL